MRLVDAGVDPMQFVVERTRDVHILRVKESKLTYPVLSSFFAAVRETVEGGARQLVVDLQAVAYIDSASIGCLMDIHRLLWQQGGTVSLSGVQPRVRTLLSMTGVHRIVDIHRDEGAALAAFGGPPQRNGDDQRLGRSA